MTNDSTKRIEKMLEVALSAMSQVAQLLKEVDSVYTAENKISIGKAIYEMMNVRTAIHTARPDLIPEQQILREQSAGLYQQFEELLEVAWNKELEGKHKDATDLYGQLLHATEIEYFTVAAQAGLFRSGSNHG